MEGCGKILDPKQNFTQRTLCKKEGAIKLSSKGGGTLNSIWVEITWGDSKTFDSLLAPRPRKSESQGKALEGVLAGAKELCLCWQDDKDVMGLRDRMEAKSPYTPAYKAGGSETLFALRSFLQERTKLPSARVPLDSGSVQQLSPALSPLQQGRLGCHRSHGQGDAKGFSAYRVRYPHSQEPLPFLWKFSFDVRKGWEGRASVWPFKIWDVFQRMFDGNHSNR